MTWQLDPSLFTTTTGSATQVAPILGTNRFAGGFLGRGPNDFAPPQPAVFPPGYTPTTPWNDPVIGRWPATSATFASQPGGGENVAGQEHYDQFHNYGWGNFTPAAQEQSGYFNQLAQWQQGQQAPQLGRTSIDWSGYGGPGQGYGSQPMGGGYGAPPPLPPGMSGQGGPPPMPTGMSSTGGNTFNPGGPMQAVANPAIQPPNQPGGPGSFSGSLASVLASNAAGGPQPGGGNTFNPGGPMGATGGGTHPMLLQSSAADQGPVARLNSRQMAAGGGWSPSTIPMMAAPSLSPNINMSSASSGRVYGQQAIQSKPANTPQNQGFQQSPYAPSVRTDPNGRPIMPGAGPGTPPAMGPGGIPAVGQFANPVFQQGQQARQMQMGYLGQLQNDMAGRGPSLAQSQLAAGMTQGINAQASGAASAGPGGYALAARTAAQNAAGLESSAINQSAQVRAQEYQAARDAYGAGTAGMRGQDITSAGQSYQNALQEAQFQQQQNQAQADLESKQRTLNYMGANADYALGMHPEDQDLSSRMHYMDLMAGKAGLDFNAYQADRANSQNMLGTGLETIGTIAALAALSDERAKENIAPADDRAISEFLAELQPRTFRYKNPEHGQGENLGIMAQDARKTPMGRLLVMDTPAGLALDVKKTVSALLAAGAHHEKRLRALETHGQKPMGRAA